MIKHLYIAFLAILSAFNGFSQQTITLTFTAIDSASYVQLDSIKVMNHTQDCDTVLYWNDTVLVLNVPVGLTELYSRKEGFKMRSFPNPVTDHATIELAIPESGETALTVSGVLGRSFYTQERELQAGSHAFQFVPGSDPLYFITATWNGYHRSIQVLSSSQNNGQQCRILYQRQYDVVAQEKAAEAMQGFTFEFGDELLYIGYADMLESGMLDSPDASQIYTFQFAYGIPCPETPTIVYEGQVYNTVQIFSQCWLKENLNVGTMISGDDWMWNNGLLEKYCYNDQEDSCSVFGGLYQWEEMMGYIYTPGVQGICPDGWHIPTDEEWMVLEGSTDSYYGIGSLEWESTNNRGFDVGLNLKSSNNWVCSGGGNGIDKYGFKALASGRVGGSGHGNFHYLRYKGYYWSSSSDDQSPIELGWSRTFHCENNQVTRSHDGVLYGYSVRCIKD